MKVIKNRFDQLLKNRGIENESIRTIPVCLDAFDKLAAWAIDQGIFDKQLLYGRISDWVKKYKLPRVPLTRIASVPDKKFKDIDDLLREMKQSIDDKARKVAFIRVSEDAYQKIMRWAVQQGATDKEEMSVLFEKAVLKAKLPGQRKYTRRRKPSPAEGENGESAVDAAKGN